MAAEGSGGRELAKLVAYHIFGDVYGHMLSAVMNGEGMTDEFWEDSGSFDQVLIGFLSPDSFMATTFFIRLSATYGPFFTDLLIYSLLVYVFDNEFVGNILLASLVTESGLAPRCDGAGPTDGRAAFATAVGVVYGVHNRAAYGGLDTHMAGAAGF